MGIAPLGPFFLLGASGYYATRSNSFLVWGVVAGTISCILHYLFTTIPPFGFTTFDLTSVRIATVIYFLVIVCVLFWLPRLDLSRWRRVDRWVGDLTYPLYLIHVPIISGLVGLGVSSNKGVLVASAVLGAYLLRLAIECPIQQLRDYVRGARLT
jgi:peptidoglycan/LPS O-acetylase OafA/YrhL